MQSAGWSIIDRVLLLQANSFEAWKLLAYHAIKSHEVEKGDYFKYDCKKVAMSLNASTRRLP